LNNLFVGGWARPKADLDGVTTRKYSYPCTEYTFFASRCWCQWPGSCCV